MEEKELPRKRAVVLYSGGLDSRLAIKLLLDQGFDVDALYFNLPYGCGCCNLNCNFNFAQKEQVKMVIMDVTKEPMLSEYLELIKNPKYGTGSGINPCKDCKGYIFIKAKEYAEEHGIAVIATGEVLGQRPMSQVSSAMKVIDELIGFEILRPLSAKLLKETEVEKKGLVDRSKLLDIQGRGRKTQMALAKEYNVSYPTPGGGCYLCEKKPSERISFLLERNLVNEKTLPLSLKGRHFFIKDTWFVVGRNSLESDMISTFETHIQDGEGKPAVYFNRREGKEKAKELQQAYSTGATKDLRESFDSFKL